MLILFPVISAATAAAISYQLPKEYESKAVVLVNPKQILLPGAQAGYYTGLDQLVQTYAQLISQPPVWQALIRVGVPRTEGELQKELKVTREPNTSLLDIVVRDKDPQVALRVSQAIVPGFNSSLNLLQAKVQTAGQSNSLDALVPWSIPRQAPTDPVSPKPLLNLALGLGAGLIIALALALVFDYLDDTVRGEPDVRLRLQLPLLGSISFWKDASRRGHSREVMALTTLNHPREPVSEAFKAIRTSLLFSVTDQERLSAILVTSSIPGEGKTSTACNLAVAMALAGHSVILVDADFRRPDLHRVFDRPENVGLGNLIIGDRPENELFMSTSLANLRVVCTGPTPPDPSELLGSTRMAALVSRLKELADVVIFDTPPVGAVTDATVLATMVDGVVMVVEGRRTSVSSIIKARDILQSVNARILGVVLNKVRQSDSADHYYHYYGAQLPATNGAKPRVPAQLEPHAGPEPAQPMPTAPPVKEA
jgi:capsular exopolysaccharide synthesis family protein